MTEREPKIVYGPDDRRLHEMREQNARPFVPAQLPMTNDKLPLPPEIARLVRTLRDAIWHLERGEYDNVLDCTDEVRQAIFAARQAEGR
jgi:hypothetical protein